MRFHEHSPEMTLGEASHCPIAKQKNLSAECGVPQPPVWGLEVSLYLGPGPWTHGVHLLLVPDGASQEGRRPLPAPPPPSLQLRFPPPGPRDLWARAHPHAALSRPGVTRCCEVSRTR